MKPRRRQKWRMLARWRQNRLQRYRVPPVQKAHHLEGFRMRHLCPLQPPRQAVDVSELEAVKKGRVRRGYVTHIRSACSSWITSRLWTPCNTQHVLKVPLQVIIMSAVSWKHIWVPYFFPKWKTWCDRQNEAKRFDKKSPWTEKLIENITS